MVAPDGGGQQQQGGQLSGEGLGGGHADLGAGVGQEYQFGFTHQGALGDIADGQGSSITELPGHAQGGQGVGGLAGLGDGDEEGTGKHHLFAIAVLTGYLDVTGQTGE